MKHILTPLDLLNKKSKPDINKNVLRNKIQLTKTVKKKAP